MCGSTVTPLRSGRHWRLGVSLRTIDRRPSSIEGGLAMTGNAVAAPTVSTKSTSQVESTGARRLWPVGLAVLVIWLAVLSASLYSPMMITGAQREQLAIAPMLDWFWASMATGLLVLAAAFARPERRDVWPVVALMTCVVWFAVAVASIFSPLMVTGSDPTIIPLMALVAPPAGVVVTAFLAVFAAGAGSEAR
jgi:hypothetical protein